MSRTSSPGLRVTVVGGRRVCSNAAAARETPPSRSAMSTDGRRHHGKEGSAGGGGEGAAEGRRRDAMRKRRARGTCPGPTRILGCFPQRKLSSGADARIHSARGVSKKQWPQRGR